MYKCPNAVKTRTLATSALLATLLAASACGNGTTKGVTADLPTTEATSAVVTSTTSVVPESVAPTASATEPPPPATSSGHQPTATVGAIPQGLVLVHTSESVGIHGEPMTIYLYASSPKEPIGLVVSLLVATPENQKETEPVESESLTNLRALDDSALPGARVYDRDAKTTTVEWQPNPSLWAAVSVPLTDNIEQLVAIAHSVKVD